MSIAPALVRAAAAAIRLPAERGVHITHLTPGGEKAAGDEEHPTKIMLGSSVGLPIVLAPANDLLAVDITEGIETGLSVLAWRGAGVWVAGSAGRMPAAIADEANCSIELTHHVRKASNFGRAEVTVDDGRSGLA